MSIQPVMQASKKSVVVLAWLGLVLFFAGLALKQAWGVPEPGFGVINRWGAWAPEWWAALTQLGDTSVVFALLAPVLCRHPRMYLAWLAAVPVGGAASLLLKRILDWPRPADVLPLDQLHVVGLVLNGRSFPSGHTITIVAVATMVALHLPIPAVWRRPVQAGLLVLVLGVMLSRMAVGAHWPSDLIAGAGLGLLAAVVAALVLHRMDLRPSRGWVWLAWAVLGITSVALLDRVVDNEPGQWVLAVAAFTIWLSFLRALWTVSTQDIADLLGLSVSYLESILKVLKANGIIRSYRGPGGGYQMDADPSELSVWEVVSLFDFVFAAPATTER